MGGRSPLKRNLSPNEGWYAGASSPPRKTSRSWRIRSRSAPVRVPTPRSARRPPSGSSPTPPANSRRGPSPFPLPALPSQPPRRHPVAYRRAAGNLDDQHIKRFERRGRNQEKPMDSAQSNPPDVGSNRPWDPHRSCEQKEEPQGIGHPKAPSLDPRRANRKDEGCQMRPDWQDIGHLIQPNRIRACLHSAIC